MQVYDSFGTFEATKADFNLAVQTTNINTDNFIITGYYDISNTTRYALLAILQTVDGNQTNFTDYPPNCACMVNDINFSNLNTSYLTKDDYSIANAKQDDVINVVVHHGIGFNPITNTYDNKYIQNYKEDIYIYYAKGSQPGRGGKGSLGRN